MRWCLVSGNHLDPKSDLHQKCFFVFFYWRNSGRINVSKLLKKTNIVVLHYLTYWLTLSVNAYLQVTMKPHCCIVFISSNELENGCSPQWLVTDTVLSYLNFIVSLVGNRTPNWIKIDMFLTYSVCITKTWYVYKLLVKRLFFLITDKREMLCTLRQYQGPKLTLLRA